MFQFKVADMSVKNKGKEKVLIENHLLQFLGKTASIWMGMQYGN